MPVDADHLLPSIAIALTLLSIPTLLIYLTHRIVRSFDPQQPEFVQVIYAYLPLTLAANLAHYVPSAITEAGQLLPVLAKTLGYSGENLFSLTWSLDVAQFLQGVTLLSALVFSVYPLLRITGRSLLSNLPHLGLMFGLIFLFFQLMVF